VAIRAGNSAMTSLRLLAGGLLDLVYPPRCLVCEQYDSPALCERCSDAFAALPDPVCAICGRPVEPEQSGPCRTCDAQRESFGENWAFDNARSAGIFEGALREALHRLKYNGGESLGLPLGAYLANRIGLYELFTQEQLQTIDGVVAVPMHPIKERSRGFNQAALLAAPVAEILGIPLLPAKVVQRARQRPAQVGLSPEDRRKNLRDAFVVPEREAPTLAGRQLLVIDDVFTTGATVNACATALRKVGVSRILIATLATGG
jgi:ComF family protein